MSLILAALTTFVVTNAPSWFASLQSTILDKGREVAIDKGKDIALTRGKSVVQRLFHLDEKEQLRHLQQALKNATERGLATFQTLEERDLYKDILQTLSQPGELGQELRQEVMRFFTLAEHPDPRILNDVYNRRQRLQNANHQDVDVTPYLNSFFSALVGELYADPYFRSQLSDVLQLRASASMQQSLLDVVDVLKKLDARLDDNYSAEDFARDVALYTVHMERTLRNLKIIGVASKDQPADPEISGIFVPLRVAFNNQGTANNQSLDTIVAALEEAPCLVLLGGPGSGKSTATKHLAWSHAAANQPQSLPAQSPLLSGHPLPLRIELRRLNEERKRANYDFLSFATEVLLKREGITINPQMFKELLARRCLLLLFDGLDEVATLNERLELVSEIEHFAVSYPGNRILVTSRPVGYDLSRISHPLFARAEVQNFDDRQIQRFLLNWYTAVLRLSPIPQSEQEELDFLLTTLKENPRLHKLAENPLLLTVMTAVYRGKHLPDSRVKFYDECAELLLEGWARLRGTNQRWQDMKMVEDDQYACVAYLGFVLHERSQEEQSTSSTEMEGIAVDVSSRFLYHCVEEFLKERASTISVAVNERRREARRFIELVQAEAGLIVERGTDENDEPLYGFVHRTFQEYFAAADVCERYQQEEDSTIVSEFLREHLHDPHWREVISLLLGELKKSKPVTNQLRQILQGKIQSRRSYCTDIVQQDLFFVCDCLIEEIKVENSLIEMVVSRLCDVVRSGWFPSQRQEALEYLAKLMHTRQCAGQGKKELIEFATKESALDVATRLHALQVLYLCSPALSEERSQALTIWTERTNVPVEQTLEAAVFLYRSSPEGSDAKQLATTILRKLVERIDLSTEQMWGMVESLHRGISPGLEIGKSELWPLIATILLRLLERADLSVEQVQEVAMSLYQGSREGSEAQQQALMILKKLVERIDLSVEQVQKMAMSLHEGSREGSDARQLATTILKGLVEREGLAVEQVQETAMFLYQRNREGSEVRQRALTILRKLVEREDLPVERLQETAMSLYHGSREGSDTQQQALTALTRLVKRIDLSVEQVRKTALSLYHSSPWGSDARRQALAALTKLVERTDLSVEQERETAESLYHRSPEGSDLRRLAGTIMTRLVERTDLSVEQKWAIAELLYRRNVEGSDARQQAITILGELVGRTDLSVEQARKTAEFLYHRGARDLGTKQQAIMILKKLVERTDLSVEQKWTTAELLYNWSSEGSNERLFATSVMLTLLSHADKSAIKNDVYDMLRSIVPQFHKLPLVEGRSRS